MNEENQPNYITTKDVEYAKNLGKLILNNAKWKASTKELMEIFQHLMWFNTLPAKLKDNIMEVKRFVSQEEMQKEKPKKKSKKEQ